MSLSTPTLVARSSNLKTPVATCVSANGKPPGIIRYVLRKNYLTLFSLFGTCSLTILNVHRWETRIPGEALTREYRNPDGTFTVQSDYILVPSKDTHKETLTCVTTYNEEVFTESVTLDIQCKTHFITISAANAFADCKINKLDHSEEKNEL